MLSQQTVLVLGAGASCEFGLPPGPGLAADIAKKLNFESHGWELRSGDRELFDALVRSDRERADTFYQAGRKIARGLPLARSIDDFLFVHGEDDAMVEVGKTAIAATILAAEARSRLNFKDARDFHSAFHALKDTWLYKLFGHLWVDVRPGQLPHLFDNLKIINFNYDRCVEHFMLYALRSAYSLNEADAAEIVKTLEIAHPYGQVGILPWQGRRGPKAEFGGGGHMPDPVPLGDVIKTYTEQSHEPAEVSRWREMIANAERIIFLGFAFHRQNMALLTPQPKLAGPWPKVFATAFETSEADRDVFRYRIRPVRGDPPPDYSDPLLAEMTCAGFMDHFGLLLGS